MALEPNGQAPYGPFSAIKLVVDRFRDRGLQTPFTQEVLAKAGVSDSLTARVLQSLKLLNLIDDEGEPAPVLKDYARLPAGEARELLGALVKDVYAPVFAFADPATDSPDRIRDAFRGFEPRGQQERMVTLFLSLCQETGLGGEVTRRPPGPRPGSGRSFRLGAPASSGRAAKATQNGSVQDVPGTLPEAVQGLLRELAQIGPSWTAERRDQFLRAWGAVIDFSYPVREPSGGDGDP